MTVFAQKALYNMVFLTQKAKLNGNHLKEVLWWFLLSFFH